jgi:transposase-like protein
MERYQKMEREEHVARWKESGLSKSAYAKAVGIKPATFYTWFNEPEGKESGFIEVRQSERNGSSGTIRIEKGDVNIHVPLSVEPKELRTILIALGGIQ